MLGSDFFFKTDHIVCIHRPKSSLSFSLQAYNCLFPFFLYNAAYSLLAVAHYFIKGGAHALSFLLQFGVPVVLVHRIIHPSCMRESCCTPCLALECDATRNALAHART